jgi:exopolysaccharide biosynthesis polyprenyl glycosylphosphotransferase
VSTLETSLYQYIDDRTLALLERRRASEHKWRRGWLVRRALVTADVVGLIFAFVVSQALFGDGQGTIDAVAEYVVFAVSLPLWIVAARCYGLYDKDEERADHSTVDDFSGVFHLVTVGTWLLYGGAYLTRLINPDVPKLMCFWALAVSGVPVARAAGRTYCRRQVEYLQNTVVVGAGDVGQSLARKLLQHPEYGVNLVGFVDSDPKDLADDLHHIAILGRPDDLIDIVDVLDVERVIIAFSTDHHDEILRLIDVLRGSTDVQVDIVPRLFDRLGPSLGIHSVEGVPLLGLPPLRLSRSALFMKRVLDVTVTVVGLVCLTPLLVLLATLIKLESRGPVFYRHQRIGREGKPFRLIKFRSMYLESCRGAEYGGDSAEEEFQRLLSDPLRQQEFATMYKLADDPRVTRVGRILRKTSLDELPQLLNVVLGDISLVGPRPVTADELERYGDGVSRFLSIRPGITGYWQINGRSRLSYDDRVRLDLSYIASWSLRLDLAILAKTARTLVRSGDAA